MDDDPTAASSRRTMSGCAARALASEANRYGPGRRLLMIGDDRRLMNQLCDSMVSESRSATADSTTLTVIAPDPLAAVVMRAQLALLPTTVAQRITVLAGPPADPDQHAADAVLFTTPLLAETTTEVAALDQYRKFVRPGGVMSVATKLHAGSTAVDRFIDSEISGGIVRSEIILGNVPPLRVHHLRFEQATPKLAETLAPTSRPSHLTLAKTKGDSADSAGIDINGVAAAGIMAGLAAAVKKLAPGRKLWLVPALAALPIAAFFRDPARRTPSDSNAIVAPADGKVLEVKTCNDERFGDEEFVRIAVFLSVLDVHINRSPVAGRVVDILSEQGGYAAAQTAAAEHNVAQYTVLETTHGRVVVAQRSGLIARRIVNRARIGALLSKGERYGLIRFGSRTDVYLPADRVDVRVAKGERVVGGESVLASWL